MTRQMRIECVKVCAPAQLAELVEGGHSVSALELSTASAVFATLSSNGNCFCDFV